MNRANRLIGLRIREIRRKITLENIIILLILTYFVYSYYTSSPIYKPARNNDTASPPIAISIHASGIKSCANSCGKKWEECAETCINQVLKCSYYYDRDEYDDIECDTKFDNLSTIDCANFCDNDHRLCFNSCKQLYNFY